MRAYLPEYELKAPKDLADALEVLAREPGVWRPFAGGTDLMVLFEAGLLAHKKFVNIWNLQELKGIEATADEITLGALTTYTEVQESEILREEFPMLCQAASETGGLAIQNRGTLAGNIANASPAGDSPPALLVYDARLELISTAGARRVSYADFHTGYKQTILKADEIISRICLPRGMKGWRQYYRKVGTRKAQAISKVCFAGAVRMDGRRVSDIRLALGSVAPTPLRCHQTEAMLKGQELNREITSAAQEQLMKEIV
ncbi:MAG: xanthine dehydrogenase family protein subunit M, partial [Pyrinomonadaceae bacterium]|nr:xanthine dehydrogenase family protein subunit M [Pyrinomonadaceae bacterium]